MCEGSPYFGTEFGEEVIFHAELLESPVKA